MIDLRPDPIGSQTMPHRVAVRTVSGLGNTLFAFTDFAPGDAVLEEAEPLLSFALSSSACAHTPAQRAFAETTQPARCSPT